MYNTATFNFSYLFIPEFIFINIIIYKITYSLTTIQLRYTAKCEVDHATCAKEQYNKNIRISPGIGGYKIKGKMPTAWLSPLNYERPSNIIMNKIYVYTGIFIPQEFFISMSQKYSSRKNLL